MPTTLPPGTQTVHTIRNSSPAFSLGSRALRRMAVTIAAALLGVAPAALAQVNGVGARPYQGWSTYSQQTIVPSSSVMNEQNILAQSDAMRASGLGAHGFQYINLDAGWNGDNDQYGRALWNTTEFPHFLQMIQHIHANGQKVGIYLLPGIGSQLVSANMPDLRHAVPRAGHRGAAAHHRQRIRLRLQDRFHQARRAGVHQLHRQPLCLVGH